MKKSLLILLFALAVTQVWSQKESKSSSKANSNEDRNFRIPLIGETAPSFTAESTNGTITFPSSFGRKWKILFSHPQDFTPVCSTEILELAYQQEEFDKLGVKVAVISTDPIDMHNQWKKALEELNLNNRGKVKIKFPIIDDENLSVSKQYGMIHPQSNSTKDVRGVFIIDPDDVIQAMYFYPSNVGRSTDELIRAITALQTSKAQSTPTTHVMTPVNWNPGKDLLVSIPPKTDASKSADVPEGYSSPIWFMWFKKAAQ